MRNVGTAKTLREAKAHAIATGEVEATMLNFINQKLQVMYLSNDPNDAFMIKVIEKRLTEVSALVVAEHFFPDEITVYTL